MYINLHLKASMELKNHSQTLSCINFHVICMSNTFVLDEKFQQYFCFPLLSPFTSRTNGMSISNIALSHFYSIHVHSNFLFHFLLAFHIFFFFISLPHRTIKKGLIKCGAPHMAWCLCVQS